MHVTIAQALPSCIPFRCAWSAFISAEEMILKAAFSSLDSALAGMGDPLMALLSAGPAASRPPRKPRAFQVIPTPAERARSRLRIDPGFSKRQRVHLLILRNLIDRLAFPELPLDVRRRRLRPARGGLARGGPPSAPGILSARRRGRGGRGEEGADQAELQARAGRGRRSGCGSPRGGPRDRGAAGGYAGGAGQRPPRPPAAEAG